MNKTLIVALFMVLGLNSFAQNWITDFEKAKQLANEQNHPIVLVFQGSDWCAPCIKLDRQIWSTETFQNYAKDHYVMLQADFPRKRKNALSETQEKQNSMLAEKYNTQGIFPFVVVMNSKGEVLGHTGYKKMTPEEYIEHLNSFLK